MAKRAFDDSEIPQLPKELDILIIGAGPTGLGAAARLTQRGTPNWAIVDSNTEAGGLACTDITPEGFLFDMGGHVIFSHFAYFDQLIEKAVGKENWNTLGRVSYVWIKNTFVPYPFQNNLYCLPTEDKIECVNGVIDAVSRQHTRPKPKTFDDWIIDTMGDGIANIFMRPYNFKVWAYPTTIMQCDWLGERVSTVNAKKVVENIILNKEDAGWGPNSVFKFPILLKHS